MPTLFRLITVLGVFAGVILGSLFVLATYFEPEQQEVSKSIRNVKPKL